MPLGSRSTGFRFSRQSSTLQDRRTTSGLGALFNDRKSAGSFDLPCMYEQAKATRDHLPSIPAQPRSRCREIAVSVGVPPTVHGSRRENYSELCIPLLSGEARLIFISTPRMCRAEAMHHRHIARAVELVVLSTTLTSGLRIPLCSLGCVRMMLPLRAYYLLGTLPRSRKDQTPGHG